jgi:oligopeptide/dipeptide ABC transporter ATP-binding protein
MNVAIRDEAMAPQSPPSKQPLLAIEELTIEVGPRQNRARVVEDLSLVVAEGEVLGLAGESGSGKTMTALSIAGLAPRGAQLSGSIRFRGEELIGASPTRLRMIRGREIGLVFQDATASLHPSKRVGSQVAEVIRVHEHASREVAWQRSLEMLDIAGIPNARERARQYPHELSGGLQQRVAIAIALAGRPSLLIADEPTTALDTTVQAQVMDRLERLQAEFGLAVLFISHDLALISEFCEHVVIMYSGQVVEDGAIDDVFRAPEHPYTELLLGAVLGAGGPSGPDRSAGPAAPEQWSGNPTSEGCRFARRCPYAIDACVASMPPLDARSRDGFVRCIRHQDLHLDGVSGHDG